MRRPCSTCPWRKDAPRRHWDPTHFLEIWGNCQDDGTHMMACHASASRREFLPCQGWLRVIGFEAIGARLAVMRGLATVAEVNDRKGPALFRSFAAMLRANGIPLPPRNRFHR